MIIFERTEDSNKVENTFKLKASKHAYPEPSFLPNGEQLIKHKAYVRIVSNRKNYSLFFFAIKLKQLCNQQKQHFIVVLIHHTIFDVCCQSKDLTLHQLKVSNDENGYKQLLKETIQYKRLRTILSIRIAIIIYNFVYETTNNLTLIELKY